MKASELIGKNAVRTQPIYEMVDNGYGIGIMGSRFLKNPNYAFTTNPIKIIKATNSHIVYTSKGSSEIFVRILDSRYCDDNWTDYDELIKIE